MHARNIRHAVLAAVLVATAGAAPPASAEIHERWSSQGYALAAGDLDGDGRMEIAVAETGGGRIAVLEASDGSVEYLLPASLGSGMGTHAVIADIDRDGLAELVLHTQDFSGPAALAVIESEGGSYRVKWETPISEDIWFISFADFTGSGRMDAVGVGRTLAVYHADTGELLFDWDDVADFEDMQIGDLDGDGADEVLARYDDGEPGILLVDGPGFAPGLGRLSANADGAVSGARLSLGQNSPNPFEDATSIRFSLETPGAAQLRVYDASGREVRRLVDGPLQAGTHKAEWDGRDDAGRRTANGVYFYELRTDGSQLDKKMIRLR